MRSCLLLPTLALAMSGCALAMEGQGAEDTFADASGKFDQAEIDADGRWKAHTDGFTLWLDPDVIHETRNGQDVWVLRGRTSKNLTDVATWIFDDGFAEGRKLSPRTLEVVFGDGQEINSMLSGLRVFVALEAAGEKQTITAAVTLGPLLTSDATPSRLSINETVRPVYVGDLLYRGRVRSSELKSLTATAPDGSAITITHKPRTTAWDVDMPFASLRAVALGTPAVVKFHAVSTTGRTYDKAATLHLSVTSVGVTRLPAEDVWDRDDTCEPAVQACLDDLSPTAVDTEACGNYRDVTRCNVQSALPMLGLAPDDRAALDSALSTVSKNLGTHEQVAADNFYVQGAGSTPALGQVTAAYLALTGIAATAKVTATLSAGAVTQELQRFGGEALLPAAQSVVQQKSFQAAALTVSTLPPWEEQRLLLYFASAGRLVVIHHATR